MNKNEKKAVDERFKQIYNQYYAAVYKFCLTKISDDSHAIEDICQDTFLILYRHMMNQENVDYPYAFLLKSADNLMKRYFKELEKQKTFTSIEDVIILPNENRDPDAKLSFEQYSKMFSAALSDSDAELFSLRYIEELDITEIADITGISVEYVSTRLYRIRKKLRKQFGNNSS